jgi:hypothetical protein
MRNVSVGEKKAYSLKNHFKLKCERVCSNQGKIFHISSVGRGNVCTIVVRVNLYTIEVYQFSPLEIQTRIWIETLNNKFLQYKLKGKIGTF